MREYMKLISIKVADLSASSDFDIISNNESYDMIKAYIESFARTHDQDRKAMVLSVEDTSSQNQQRAHLAVSQSGKRSAENQDDGSSHKKQKIVHTNSDSDEKSNG